MTVTRIYQAVEIKLHAALQLDESASHHLARVLRRKVGEKIILFNGFAAGEYEATITQIDKKQITVVINAFKDRQVESPIRICLAQGIARGEKMDWIVQKATELGVHEIVPLMTERCNVKLDQERMEKRLQHWRLVAINASEQSGRVFVPAIMSPLSLEEWLAQTNAELKFVLSPHQGQTFSNFKLSQPNGKIALLIGPEGGLSDAEIKKATQHGFLPLNLGPRILRTETAPLAAISALQCFYGDLG